MPHSTPARIVVALLLCASTITLRAQDKPYSDRFSLGMQLGQLQQDFAFGAQCTSPYFGGPVHMAVRGQFNLAFLDHIADSTGATTWTAYNNVRLGLVFGTPVQGGFFRYYGEGGALLVLPNDAFSSQSTELGFYGLFGFEFLFSENDRSGRAFFFELGGVGTGARADKVPGEPIYSNGLLLGAGFRFHIGGSK